MGHPRKDKESQLVSVSLALTYLFYFSLLNSTYYNYTLQPHLWCNC